MSSKSLSSKSLSSESPRSRPLRILVVEDEILIALELEGLMQDEGHEVVGIASTSHEAIRMAEELRPDLALVDIHLADGPTGIEVARRLSADREIAVVFMTANAKRIPHDFAGALGVVAKPYTERGVLSALRYVAEAIAGGRDGCRAPDSLTLAPVSHRPPAATAPERRRAAEAGEAARSGIARPAAY